MSIPDYFPRRASRAVPATAPSPAGIAEDTSGGAASVSAPASWQWRRAALLLSIAAQLITIAALAGADPIPASWSALLLAVAPAPLALLTAFAPAPVPRLAAPLTVVVLLIGLIGQATHTGLFFLPALAAMVVATLRLWREEA